EKTDRCIGFLRRLIGVEPEVVECAPANRICVLVLRKCLCVPSYGIGSLSNSPRSAAISLVVERAVVCPTRFLRRRVEADVTDVHSGCEGHAERLDSPIEVLIVQCVLIVPNSGT